MKEPVTCNQPICNSPKANPRVLMAMSGGIDSTVAAMLLQDQGYELVGVTYRVYDQISQACMEKEKGCCSVNAIFEAKHMALQMGFEHHILDIRKDFNDLVIRNFIDEYLQGHTPNPCVLCNSTIKWGKLIAMADELGCDYIATGHYARIGQQDGRYFLRKGVDETKDQTYFLWTLTQENLARTIFPLGELTKPEVRQIALEKGYENLSKKSESQEICFIPDNDYRTFRRTWKTLQRNTVPDCLLTLPANAWENTGDSPTTRSDNVKDSVSPWDIPCSWSTSDQKAMKSCWEPGKNYKEKRSGQRILT